MKKLKAGIIGGGYIAKMNHIPTYKKMKKTVELCAICDLNEKLAKETANNFQIPSSYTDISQMLSNEDLDIVDICVPPKIHAPLAIEAIENGCNVIMEKPMALVTSDCDNMINSARKNNVKLCVIHNNIFHPPFLKAIELVESGAIGDFIGMDIFLSTPRDHMIDLKDHWYHKLPGGVLGETAPHVVYMTLSLLNKVDNVNIIAKNFLNHSWAPHDEFRIGLEGDNGLSMATLSYTCNHWIGKISILGTESILHLDLQSMLLENHKIKELSYIPIGKNSISTIYQNFSCLTNNVIKVSTGMQKIGTEVVIEGFVDCILNDSPPPVTGEDGRETVKVMEMLVNNYNEKYGKK